MEFISSIKDLDFVQELKTLLSNLWKEHQKEPPFPDKSLHDTISWITTGIQFLFKFD